MPVALDATEGVVVELKEGVRVRPFSRSGANKTIGKFRIQRSAESSQIGI